MLIYFATMKSPFLILRCLFTFLKRETNLIIYKIKLTVFFSHGKHVRESPRSKLRFSPPFLVNPWKFLALLI